MPNLLEIDRLQIDAKTETGTLIPIVKDISFSVKKGEVVALIGESGSGKTTIALSALAYTKPGLTFTSGEVRLEGQDILKMQPAQKQSIRGERVAYLAQSAAATFNPALTIGEQVTESAILHGHLTLEEADLRSKELYKALELPEPENLGKRYPHQVSGGQLQRLMAAMALCSKPDLLVLDEPTTALDVTTQIEVLKAFKNVIQHEGSAAIYVTHDLSVVAQIADNIIVLYGGEIQEYGSTSEIIDEPKHPYTQRLMAAVRPPPVESLKKYNKTTNSIVIPLLEVNNITASYANKKDKASGIDVLREVNLSAHKGETIGVIGESGCGKSSLARVISGLLPAKKGNVFLNGEKLEASLKGRSRDNLQKIQFVFQMADTALNPRQRVDQIIGRPLEFYHDLKGEVKKKRVQELLQMVDLSHEISTRFPEELSGGQKQRINLARALAASPEVLLCDEVISALDTIVGANVIELLKRLQKQTNVSFIFISHDLSTIASFANQVIVLYAGQIVEQGPTNMILSPPYHPYTRLLISSVPELKIGWLEGTIETQEAKAGIDREVKLSEVGCPFYERCPIAMDDLCKSKPPPIHYLNHGHTIACHRNEEAII